MLACFCEGSAITPSLRNAVLAVDIMLLPLALLLLPPAGRRALAPPAVRATMQARYTRGEDGGGTVDEQRVQELIARRGELRRMRNFKGADGVPYEVRGEVGSVFNILSSPRLSINSLFVQVPPRFPVCVPAE